MVTPPSTKRLAGKLEQPSGVQGEVPTSQQRAIYAAADESTIRRVDISI
jgi:hypothetical protein